ncbi:MAG: galactose mutarotase [Candidatus Symbiothrix sp.]|jgi:aldose 1-epimerase|nr:galactose mutarotase [Candidatus Symbiothrix sp.]
MKKTITTGGLYKEGFRKTVDGKPVDLFTLSNKNGLEVSITNYGGKIVSILVPGKNGTPVDVVLGKSNLDDYMNAQEPYFGAICGRIANRIADGKFSLEGNDYQLAVNNGPNSLHGGIKGFNAVVWDAKQPDGQTLELAYLSKDGEEGFPGNLSVLAVYRLTDDNALEIAYRATTDKTTILNLTNHSYFNLSGEGDPYIGDHELQINADSFLPTSDVAIPLGRPEPVEDTPFDFRSLHTIGERIEEEFTQLIYGNGYDHNFILNGGGTELIFCAKAISPKTGIQMEVYTDQPGVQLYTGNFLEGNFTGKNGHHYPKRSAFCLETQHYPDSIHHPDYPSTVLKPGEVFESRTIFKFSK